MSRRPLLGLSLHADRGFLSRHARLIENEAELFEVMPESLWRADAAPDTAYELFRDLRERSGRPFVAHGTLFSLGACPPPARRERWLDALRRDQGAFEFSWFSDHLGFQDSGGLHTALPLPLPPSEAAADVCAESLRELRGIFPVVAFENNVGYLSLGDPRRELDLFRAVCERSGCSMLLDLHNAYTQAHNFGLDLEAYLAGLDCARVIEIHVSGGRPSEPAWLASKRTFRLDSHDDRVPEAVWDALESVLPRCPNLRAVVVERVPERAGEESSAHLADDFARARAILDAAPKPEDAPPTGCGAALDPAASREELADVQRDLVHACLADEPTAELASRSDARRSAAARSWLEGVDPDGLRLTGLLVKKLRFERLVAGEPALGDAFAADPEGFTDAWRAYDRACPPTAVMPSDEVALFREHRSRTVDPV